MTELGYFKDPKLCLCVCVCLYVCVCVCVCECIHLCTLKPTPFMIQGGLDSIDRMSHFEDKAFRLAEVCVRHAQTLPSMYSSQTPKTENMKPHNIHVVALHWCLGNDIGLLLKVRYHFMIIIHASSEKMWRSV